MCLAIGCWTRACAQPPAPEAIVRSFHNALLSGNITQIKQFLAADATIIEGGHVESRDEYLSRHLFADIEFARAVSTQLLNSRTTVNGATAWVWSASASNGTFRSQPIKLVGAELVILTQTGSSWKIRAIHWSSYKPK